MCNTLRDRLSIAKQVAEKIDGKIVEGAPNIQYLADGGVPGVPPRREEKFWEMHKKYNKEIVGGYEQILSLVGSMESKSEAARKIAEFRGRKHIAKRHGVAQCGEYASYAFWRLYKRGVFPIAYIVAQNVNFFGNHSFVAIGLKPDAKKQKMSTWPDDVVICDPWLMKLLEVLEAPKKEDKGAYTVKEYIKFTEDFFEDGDDVDFIFGVEGIVGGEIPKLIPN